MGALQSEIGNALAILIGKRLWACRRAADMATFQFGTRSPTRDFYGRATEVGEHALHVQCAWRIVQGGDITVGSKDLYYPAKYDDSQPLPPDFDWDHDPNRRDALLQDLFSDGQPELVVQKIEAGLAGSFRITLGDDTALEVFPDDSLAREHWRLLSPTTEAPHFVVSGKKP